MRKVIVSRYTREPDAKPTDKWVLKPVGEAVFLEFGVDYEELNDGIGNFSTAIVEWGDGTVENIPVGNIRFVL